MDAIRTGLFADNRYYEGDSADMFSVKKDLPKLDRNTILFRDIQRFSRFSDGFIAYDPTQNKVLGDIRYSMLPTSVEPLWGIVINHYKPNDHADYRFFRDNSPHVRQTFLKMLFGR